MTHKWAGVNRLEDVCGELILAQLINDRLGPRLLRRHDRSEHALDLVKPVLQCLNVSFRRASAEARGWNISSSKVVWVVSREDLLV